MLKLGVGCRTTTHATELLGYHRRLPSLRFGFPTQPYSVATSIPRHHAYLAVFGATGAQGGSVCPPTPQNPEWKIRGITRNVNSPAAKKLAEQGVEVVSADINNLPSVTGAITGATGVFGITFFWDMASIGLSSAAEAEL
ncbi:hypothetical protein B0T14DRAFT_580854 [Immersiella caudata]|uniref:NmrA-like domain-containing protein n=1 Tax=Immersiella caudata TaxID=314043 RepID=A0AA39WVT7_9PEZI|nr:hypothetical protein B0T14DRAFT_580854 [Immersiella caudata]